MYSERYLSYGWRYFNRFVTSEVAGAEISDDLSEKLFSKRLNTLHGRFEKKILVD